MLLLLQLLPPPTQQPSQAKLVIGEDDVLVLGDDGFSVESRTPGGRLADTRWFELKEEELSRSSDEASSAAMIDSLSEVRAILDGAKAVWADGASPLRPGAGQRPTSPSTTGYINARHHRRNASLGDDPPFSQVQVSDNRASQVVATAARAPPSAALQDRLVVGKRVSVPPHEREERTRRLVAKLPEIVEKRREIESRRDAEARRRQVQEWENARRGRVNSA